MQRRRMNFYCSEIFRKKPEKNPNFGNDAPLHFKVEHLSENLGQVALIVRAFNISLGFALGDFADGESTLNYFI